MDYNIICGAADVEGVPPLNYSIDIIFFKKSALMAGMRCCALGQSELSCTANFGVFPLCLTNAAFFFSSAFKFFSVFGRHLLIWIRAAINKV